MEKKNRDVRDGWTDGWMIDGWIVDEVMGGWCRLLFGDFKCGCVRQMCAYRGGVCGFCLRWKCLHKEYLEDVGVKAIVLTPVFSLCRRACARLYLVSIPVLRAGPVCTVSWHIFSAALGCELC